MCPVQCVTYVSGRSHNVYAGFVKVSKNEVCPNCFGVYSGSTRGEARSLIGF